MDNTIDNANELDSERPSHPPLYEQLYPTSHQVKSNII